ncbi:MAG TPA: GAF and ANTAR domain-containing protein [Egibacteraceae bacterium]|nr:GAF and ANTAR domain-containing protein [Egibacteraceae bacterium]
MFLVDRRRGRRVLSDRTFVRPDAAAGKDDPDLATSIERLGTLVLADQTVESVLALVVDLAVGTIPAAEAASASLWTDEREPTVLVATEGIAEADRLQYERRRGPAIEALRTSRRVSVCLDRAPEGWTHFADAAASAGFHALLALPLRAADRTVGVLLLYSRSEGAFGPKEIEVAERFTRHAAATAANATTLSTARHTQRTLEESVATRELIGQAQGILMARHNCTAQRAFAMLRRSSQRSNRKLRDVAAEVVAELERGASE